LEIKEHVAAKVVPELQAVLPVRAFLMALVEAPELLHLSALQLMPIAQEVELVAMADRHISLPTPAEMDLKQFIPDAQLPSHVLFLRTL
jgi:hypothetical protein